MKVAVSIPNDVFNDTEALAKRLNTSRSELYSRALAEFLGRNAPGKITELMDRVVADVGQEPADAFQAAAARSVFSRTEW